jgi:tight adherence protein C
MEIAIIALAFGCVFTLVFGASMVLRPKPAEQRLARLSQPAAPTIAMTRSMLRGQERGILGFFRKIGEKGGASGDMGKLRRRFVHAGFKSPAAPAIYYGIRVCASVGIPALAGLFPAVWSLGILPQVGLLVLLTSISFVGPSVYIDHRIKSRQGSIDRVLPDALDLMVVCVEAGLGINESLARVAKEFRGRSRELSDEFSLVGHETRAGKTTTEALRGLAERTGVSDISSLVGLLVQTERFGTSVGKALRVHADSMRIKRMQRAEERAQKATLKLILPSTLIFMALLLVFLTPGMHGFFSAFSAIE